VWGGAVDEVCELEDAVGGRPGDRDDRRPLAHGQLAAAQDEEHERGGRREVAAADGEAGRPAHEVVGQVAELAEQEGVKEGEVPAPIGQLACGGERHGGEHQLSGDAGPDARDRRAREQRAALAGRQQPGAGQDDDR
jgi:hypothetical protein